MWVLVILDLESHGWVKELEETPETMSPAPFPMHEYSPVKGREFQFQKPFDVHFASEQVRNDQELHENQVSHCWRRAMHECLEKAKLSLVLSDWSQRYQCELTVFNTHR